ncbi:MAG: hypothetical protein LBN39_05160 [Planctomycetaceae bacterium]|jgi:hypothetical protein|nr:hypothetical protein [Planctomycetaceae bacterium]
MRTFFAKRTAALISGICLTVSLLTAAAVQAEELKPFFTVKIAGPATILDVAGKVAELAGQTRVFDTGIAPYKDLKGFNAKGPIGLVLRTNGDEIKEPLLILPVTDLTAIEIPGFEAVLAGAKKISNGKYLLNSPVGNYTLEQKKDFLLVFPEESKEPLPEAPEKLLADLDAYTIGCKVDFENVSMDAINMLLAPVQMLMAMQGGEEASKSLDALVENIEQSQKNVRSVTGGLIFDTKTADLEISGVCVPKKDSDVAKQIAALKNAKTAFSGFRGTGDDVILSFGGVETGTAAKIETTMDNLDRVIEGALAQVEEQAEDDADVELAKSLADSVTKILEATLKKDKIDVAGSFAADGTWLFAASLAETEEVKKAVRKLIEHLAKKAPGDTPNFFDAKYFSADYATTEGFKLSSIKYQFTEQDKSAADFPKFLADKTVSVFWGFKENEAFVVAFGLDFDKTKKAFEGALAKTKESVAVQQPIFVLAAQPLGKLIGSVVAADTQKLGEAAKLLIALNKVGKDAKVTVSNAVEGENLKTTVKVSGSLIKVLADMAVEAAATAAKYGGQSDRSQIKDF